MIYEEIDEVRCALAALKPATPIRERPRMPTPPTPTQEYEFL